MCSIREAIVEDQDIHLYHIGEYQTGTAGEPGIYQTPGINRFSRLPTEADRVRNQNFYDHPAVIAIVSIL